MKAVPLYRIQADSNRSTYIRASQSMKREGKELGCVDIWCIMDTCQRLNYAMNNGRKSLNFCAHAQTSTLERRTIAGATSRPSCGWHEVVLLGDCCLSTTVTGTAYISASHAGVKRVYGNECISILCKTPIWSMSSLIALWFALIPVLLEPPKKRWPIGPSSWPEPRRVQYQDPRERGWIGQPVAL